jgi:glycosyltransferase involved in cell wall biosynthesis
MRCEGGATSDTRPRVLVVGAGTHFLSAMSYYTIRLTNALAGRFSVAAIPMRQLIPTFLYPGRARVGVVKTELGYDPAVEAMPGVDWFWGRNLFRNLIRVRKHRPDVVVFEWWTGTVLHTYLAIAIVARLLGASIVVEFHEILDSGEERIPMARAWVWALGRPFFRLASGFVIHSDADRALLEKRYRIGERPCVLIPHGPFDHHVAEEPADPSAPTALRVAPPGALNLLYFGIIRAYKGLEDLVEAFGLLDDGEVHRYWLTIVGEPWEGWDLPMQRIRTNPHRERITFVDRFVNDDEVRAYFGGADAVVLPYHRSSASGPAHIAMSGGLPLVLTSVGGLPAAVADYEGAVLVPPHDPEAIRNAIRRLPELCGRRYRDPHSWDRTVESTPCRPTVLTAELNAPTAPIRSSPSYARRVLRCRLSRVRRATGRPGRFRSRGLGAGTRTRA